MRTYLTITLLLWASLASQAQAAGAVPVRDAGRTMAAICSGQGLAKACLAVPDQGLACLPSQTQSIAPAQASSSYAPSAPTPALAIATASPSSPRAP